MYEIFERLLKERGGTTYQVAKATGISTAAFTGWKQGKWNFKVDKLQKIADYFDVPLQYLVSGTYDAVPDINRVLINNLKERIKELADKQNISLPALEAKLGFGNGTIVKWDKSIPNADKLNKVAKYFNVSMEYLLNGEDACPSSDFSSKDITVTISDEEYHLLQDYASWLEKHEQKHFDKTERETSDEWTVEDIIMLAIKDQLCICRMSLETG